MIGGNIMKLTYLLEKLEYEVIQGNDQIEITELVNDSRKVVEGSVFVCIIIVNISVCISKTSCISTVH